MQAIIQVSKWQNKKVVLHGPVSYTYLCRFVKYFVCIKPEDYSIIHSMYNTYKQLYDYLENKIQYNSIFDLCCRFYNYMLKHIATFDIEKCGNSLDTLITKTVYII